MAKRLTAAQVIDRVFGGSKKASEYLCVSPQAVTMMKARNRFAIHHWPKVIKACQVAGVSYDPSLR